MRAEIVEGNLVIWPENTTEDFALKHWRNTAYVSMEDEVRMERGHIRDSYLKCADSEGKVNGVYYPRKEK